jgi:hypothetical protein
MYLHIGLPKTGTTFLQRQFFPALCAANGLTYFGKQYRDGDSYQGLSASYRTPMKFTHGKQKVAFPFSNGPEPAAGLVRFIDETPDGAALLQAGAGKQNLLYSNELLLWKAPADAARAIRFYGHAGTRVVLTTREPLFWVRSFYLYYTDAGRLAHGPAARPPTVAEFCDAILRGRDEKLDIFSLGLGGRAAREFLSDVGAVIVDGLALCCDPSMQIVLCERLGLSPVTVSGERENTFLNKRGLDVGAITAEFEEQAPRFEGLGYSTALC